MRECQGELVDGKADGHAAQVRRLRQAHEADEGDGQRHDRVQQVAPGHAFGRGRVAPGHQRGRAQGADLDQDPHQHQVVGQHAQVDHQHEQQHQPCAGADVALQGRRGALARVQVDADAQEHGVDHQHEQHRGRVEHEMALGQVQRQLGQRNGDEHAHTGEPHQRGHQHQGRGHPASAGPLAGGGVVGALGQRMGVHAISLSVTGSAVGLA
ncbi:hypothetical protein D9M69_540980 [compost metagenome]